MRATRVFPILNASASIRFFIIFLTVVISLVRSSLYHYVVLKILEIHAINMSFDDSAALKIKIKFLIALFRIREDSIILHRSSV